MAIPPRTMMGLPNSPSFRYKALNPAYQSDPRRILGQQLQQQGLSSAPVRTPLQGLGRLSSALIGAYLQKGAIDRQVARENEYQNQLANALSGLDLSSTPILANFAQQFPEQALPIALSTEAKKATTKPIETFTTLSNEQAQAKGLDISRGQVYQIGSVSGSIKNISGSQTGSMGSMANMLNRAIELNNMTSRSNAENQELLGLKEILSRPTNINTINPTTGDTEFKQIPGINLNSILTNNVSQETQNGTKPEEKPIITKKAKLTALESKFVSNLSSASGDIKEVIDKLFYGNLNGDVNRGLVTALNVPGGTMLSGDAQIVINALNNLADLTTRDRSGATAPEEERKFFFSQILPNATDTSDTIRFKIKRLINNLNTNVSAFASGRVIDGLPDIKISDYVKNNTNNQPNKNNKINLPN